MKMKNMSEDEREIANDNAVEGNEQPNGKR